MLHCFSNAILFNGRDFVTNNIVFADDNTILAVSTDREIPSEYTENNLDTHYLCPGLLDLQIYGGNGVLFSEKPTPASLFTIEKHLISTGTTGFLITLPTVPFEVIEQSIKAIKAYMPMSMGALLGLHVEGPYINPIKKGAHKEAWIKKPTEAEIQMLVAAAHEGIVKMVTLAPEMVEPAIIKRLSDAGIVVSAGHTFATYEQYMAAFKTGINHATHLYNAMPQLEGRNPGLLGAVADSPNVMASIVIDGQHVHYPSVRIMKKVLGERLYCITDAVTGTERLHFKNDAFYNEKEILTGSALTMPKTIANNVREVGIPIEEAIRMATVYPAKVLGASDRLGCIKVGAAANFTVLDKDFAVKSVWIGGKRCY